MDETQDIKIAAMISVPICGWNPHWQCHSQALRPFGIPVEAAYGAWWDHGVSNLLEDFIDKGIDWALAMDYDSMFTAAHLSRLIDRFAANSQIDALAALEAKRVMPVNGIVDECPLLKSKDGNPEIEIDGSAVEVAWAHFGLTLIRLESLKKVPKPWFLHVPDKNGSYRGDDRIDPDIYFWNKWREHGNTVFVDPMVRIGHLHPQVAVFDDDFRVQHLHWIAWRRAEQLKELAA